MTLWKPSAALAGAAAITFALCLLIPMLGATRRALPPIEADPVPLAVLPAETPRDTDAGGGPADALPAPARAPVPPSTPLSLPSVPVPADLAVRAAMDADALSGLSLAAPSAPEGDLAGPGGPGFDQPPRVLTRLDPYYPEAARRSGAEGHVTVRALVDEYGRVAEADVIRSEPAGVFDAAALKAVRGWRFSPARRADRPVAVRIDIPIRFRLDQ